MNTNAICIQEGRIPVGEHQIWYRSVGGGEQHEDIPLLLLHGGPGAAASYYLKDLQALASGTRRVILYDQLGCGHSDRPDNPELWHVEYFVQELDAIRKALGLDTVHLWGHSWGGMLAIEYALTQPQGLASLILASSLPSIPMWMAEANRLRGELPAEIQETLTRHEKAGTTESDEYLEAADAFYSRYLIRLSPVPEHVQRAMAELATAQVYLTMNGPSEFHIVGVYKDWDRTDRLGEIHVPTLLTSGRYDESTPMINTVMHNAIANSEWIVFENSAHMSHIEENERYLSTLRAFLERVETYSFSRFLSRS